ncbi:MAG: hypothetical protein PHU43_03850 [Candidatus Bipolaricaulis sp.]|nr:hypothetical protein [Candidatus Bipolaricaulis sp.]
MMAGWRVAGALALLGLAVLATGAVAQDAATSPTLDEVAALNLTASPEQIRAAVGLLADSVTAGTLSVDQAIQLLIAADWAALADGAAIDAALATLTDLVAGITAGTLTLDEALAALGASETGTTPDGFLDALAQAGASEATGALAEALVAAGVPPGIVVRIVKQGLNQDALTDEEVQALLATLGELADGDSWGKLANEIAGHGSYRHRDRENNVNRNDGTSDDPEQETEQNEHGSQGKGHGKNGGK